MIHLNHRNILCVYFFSMLVVGLCFVCWIHECLCSAAKSIEDSAVGVGRSCSLDMQVLLCCICVCVWREE